MYYRNQIQEASLETPQNSSLKQCRQIRVGFFLIQLKRTLYLVQLLCSPPGIAPACGACPRDGLSNLARHGPRHGRQRGRSRGSLRRPARAGARPAEAGTAAQKRHRGLCWGGSRRAQPPPHSRPRGEALPSSPPARHSPAPLGASECHRKPP